MSPEHSVLVSDWTIVSVVQSSCGFQRIDVEESISHLVHDEIERILYYPTPMFAICALEKSS